MSIGCNEKNASDLGKNSYNAGLGVQKARLSELSSEWTAANGDNTVWLLKGRGNYLAAK